MSKEKETSLSLSLITGEKGDACPICLEEMPVMKFRQCEDRCRLVCCGQFICVDCYEPLRKQYQKSNLNNILEQLFAMSEEGGANQQNNNSGLVCPCCRAPACRTDAEAFELCLKNAMDGRVWAMFDVGLKYQNGIGVEINHEEAARWWRIAAEQGHCWAMEMYAGLLEEGVGVQKSIPEAKQWYESAFTAGLLSPAGQVLLGQILEQEDESKANKEKVVEMFQRSADEGYCEAQCLLGIRYSNGDGVECDLDKSLYWCTKAADQGHSFAMAHCGILMIKIADKKYGHHMIPGKSPVPRALQLFRKALAADQDCQRAAELKKATEEDVSSRCNSCGKAKDPTMTKNFMKCRKCKAAFYCGRNCQVKHWKAGHKVDCCNLE